MAKLQQALFAAGVKLAAFVMCAMFALFEKREMFGMFAAGLLLAAFVMCAMFALFAAREMFGIFSMFAGRVILAAFAA